jgi:hypothetical protein
VRLCVAQPPTSSDNKGVGVEARISHLKRGVGLRRLSDAKTWVGLGILTSSLVEASPRLVPHEDGAPQVQTPSTASSRPDRIALTKAS